MAEDELSDEGSSDESLPTTSADGSRDGCGTSQQGEVTQILSAIEDGNGQAAEQLLPLVYEELRRLASSKMACEKPGQTLQATALVHEAYVRLVGQTAPQLWDSRRHFFAAAAEAMRRILVERARSKAGPEAGGDRRREELSAVGPVVPAPRYDILALSEALDLLSAQNPRVAELVKLRFFVGMTRQQAATVLFAGPAFHPGFEKITQGTEDNHYHRQSDPTRD